MATPWFRSWNIRPSTAFPCPTSSRWAFPPRSASTPSCSAPANGGGEIVGLLKTFGLLCACRFGIAMAEAYLNDQKRILPCAAYVNGEYGVTDLYVGVPVVIGAGGVEKVVEIELDEEAKAISRCRSMR
jgi:hypothetical protein